MKKEILTLQNVYAKCNTPSGIEDINLSIYERDIVCLVGTTDSGKDLLFDVLCGREKDVEGDILIEEKRLDYCSKAEYGQVAVISDVVDPFPVDDWLVYEYLLMMNCGTWGLLFVKKEKAAALAQEFLDMIQLDISPKEKWGNLNQTDKLILSFLRAYIGKKKLVLLEYGFDGYNKDDFDSIRHQIYRMSQMGLTFVINCNSAEVSLFLGKRFVVFRGGRICKKSQDAFVVRRLMERILGKSSNYHMSSSYKTRTVHCSGAIEQKIYVNRSEFVVLIEKDYVQKKKVFDSLSGRKHELDYYLVFEGMLCQASGVDEYVKSKIVSIGRLDHRTELIQNLKIAENLLLPSIKKVSNFLDAYPVDVIKALERQVEKLNISSDKSIDQLTDLEYLIVLFERWYIFQPKVLILLEPFLFCDTVQIEAIMKYIEKFIAIGTGVIVITSNDVNIVTPNL